MQFLSYLISGISLGSVYALIALGYTMVYGIAKMLNFAHGDARGLMQITEITFDWIKSRIAPSETLTFDDLYDPEVNIRFGSYYVAYCLLEYGDLATAAAAYHSGLGTVGELLANPDYSSDGRTLDEFPYPQMRRYVHKITTSYARYCEIYASDAPASAG